MTIDTDSPEATEAVAARLAVSLRGGETIALVGPLGAGKTRFVRGLARGLGIDLRNVRSPSFTVHHRYPGGRLVLDHYDAYFVRESAEFARDGLFEQLDEGHVVVVEWADRFEEEFRGASLTVELRVTGEESRRLVFRGELSSSLAT